jgi:hypothetical protein
VKAVLDGAAIDRRLAENEAVFADAPRLVLAIREDVEAVRDEREEELGLQPPRSKTMVTRRGPTSRRTSGRSFRSIWVSAAFAWAVTTKSGSPAWSWTQ